MNVNLLPRKEIVPDSDTLRALSAEFALSPRVIELLWTRGIDTKEKLRKYLVPDVSDLYDPFLMKGMAEAAERIRGAIERKEKVVIYGDYDADGICAASVLSLYLSSCGADVYVHIPNRVGDGYGLNVDSIEHIIEECCPDLILTCDCGISGRKEVECAMDLGVDVIVTDHHEVSDTVPECIVVNPKQSDCAYPYEYLCGAGVALKLVQALGGIDAAMQFVDLVAVATIADLVPLLDENRLIVQLGLKKLEDGRNLGLKAMIEDQKISYPISSGDIAYKIAPRINAAGRMGDAYRSFRLLTSADTKEVQDILAAINEDNVRRKKLCDKLYEEALVDLRYEDLLHSRAVILGNPEWEKGITGILAARLAGDFHRPAFIMVNSGDCYKGTARSVPGINIYELLSAVGDILVEFGGHSQAAGFSIAEKNIPLFRERVNEYLRQFPDSYFEMSQEYDMRIDADELNTDLARELECIEPSGNANTRPLFLTTVRSLSVAPLKSNHMHTTVTLENGLSVMAFNFYEQNQFLMGDAPKDLILELQLNTYGGKMNAKGILRAVSPSALYINDAVAHANYVKTLSYGVCDGNAFRRYTPADLPTLLENRLYGTLVIAGCRETYEACASLPQASAFLHEFLYPTGINNYSRLIVSPDFGNLLLTGYDRIVFLDTPPGYAMAGYLAKKTKAEIYLPAEDNQAKFYEGLTCRREVFGGCFAALRRMQGLTADNLLSYYKLFSAHCDIDRKQFVACIVVFTELQLLQFGKAPFSIRINEGKRCNLHDSPLYRFLAEKTGEQA